MKKRSPVVCAVGAAIMAGPTWAIDYQPFDWVSLPHGTEVLSFYYELSCHEVGRTLQELVVSLIHDRGTAFGAAGVALLNRCSIVEDVVRRSS